MDHLIYVHLCKQTSSNFPIRITPPFGTILICPFTLRNKYDIPKLHYDGHLFLLIGLPDIITDAQYPENEVDKT